MTLPLKPFTGVSVTCSCRCALSDGQRCSGEACKHEVRSALQPGKLKLPMAVLQLNPCSMPVDFTYSSLNQKVQSSVGSTVTEL